MTPQSKSLMTAPFAGRRAPKPVVDQAHQRRHAEADEQIADRRDRKGLETVESVVLDVPALRGQLEHADRQADRRHLDRDQELGGERPEDRAQAERQHDQAIRLQRAEPGRERRRHQMVADRGDAGAHLLGDARSRRTGRCRRWRSRTRAEAARA